LTWQGTQVLHNQVAAVHQAAEVQQEVFVVKLLHLHDIKLKMQYVSSCSTKLLHPEDTKVFVH
jgi:hypothetical protein